MSAPIPRAAAYAATVASLALGLAVGHVVLPAATSARKVAAPSTAPAESAPPSQPARRYQIPVTGSQPALGPADALVTLVHFCDFQSAECRQLASTLEALRARHADTLRVVFRHFAPRDQASMPSHELAQIAHTQGGKFWQVQALLMKAGRAPDLAVLERIAREAGMDWEATRQGLDKHSYGSHVIADRVFADMFEVERAPAVFVNGRKLAGAPTRSALDALIAEELAGARSLLARGVARDAIYAELVKDGYFRRPGNAAP